MKQFRDVIARKRPRQSQPGGGWGDAPVTDFREIAAARTQDADPVAPFVEEDDEVDEPVPGREDDAMTDMTDMPPPAPRHAPEEAAQPRNKIWDIEAAEPEAPGDTAPEIPHRARRAQMAAEALKQIEAQKSKSSGGDADRQAPAAPSAASAPSGRAKTRILGFHAAEIAPDVFSAPTAPSAAAGQFPAGWLVVVDGPGRGASFTVGAGVSTIGRDTDQTICLDFGDMSVSRQNHASVAYDDEQNRFFIGHGGKSNIVRRNCNPVLATEDLADADLIRIGKTTLRFVALCGPDFTWGTQEERQDADAPDA
jgi:hypothetical protein